MLLFIHGSYGAQVGGRTVFTRERAEERFRAFVRECYGHMSVGAVAALEQVADDMHRIGYDFDELEQMELDELRRMACEAAPAQAQRAGTICPG